MKWFPALFVLFCISNLLTAQEEDAPYYIHSIYFGGGSYYVTEQQVEELNKWLDEIPNVENNEISIHSHTDDIGGKEYNEWLSRMRSETALQLLLQRDIPRETIMIEDFGELNPVYDNSTWEGRLKNRRVDIIIKKVIL